MCLQEAQFILVTDMHKDDCGAVPYLWEESGEAMKVLRRVFREVSYSTSSNARLKITLCTAFTVPSEFDDRCSLSLATESQY